MHKLRGEPVKKGDVLIKLYAESEKRLSYATKLLENMEPMIVRKRISQEMIIDVIPSKKHDYKKEFYLER